MTWYPAALIALHLDLQPLLRRLKQLGVVCRVTEEQGKQCIWVLDETSVARVEDALAQWREAGFERHAWSPSACPETRQPDSEQLLPNASTGLLWRFLGLLLRYPVTLLLIVLGCAGALLVEWDRGYEHIALLTMQPIAVQGDRLLLASLGYGLEQGQWWRVITPVFLHFGALHIIFNALWVWEFGRRIERNLGHGIMLAVALTVGIGSNLAQYYWEGPSLFGGLSGMLYGFLGFIAVWQKKRPLDEPLSEGIIVFMLIWLVLCMSGLVNFFVDGRIANAAHVSGLLLGALLALFVLAMRPGRR